MNGLDVLNTAPSGGATVQAVAARAGDAAPDDPGGDGSRSFNALLATFSEPATAAADGPAQPSAATFVTPPLTVLRQTLQVTSEAMTGNAAEAELPSEGTDEASSDKNASAASDDLTLADLVGGSQAPATTSQQDAAVPPQGVAPWSAAISGAVGLMMPALLGSAAGSPTPVSLRQPDAQSRGGQQSLAANADVANSLSTDVGHLLDAAAGATGAVLTDGAATEQGVDLVLNSNVTVLRTETHLPPVTPTSPLHQIVNAITTDGLAAAQGDTSATGAPETTLSPGPDRQLVRTLDIRLEPPDLGSVTVKLRLSGQHLALRISADTVSTAQSLEQDRDTLLSLLRGNGYTPELSAVRHEPAAAAATAIANASGTDAAASSQSASNQAGSQGSTDSGARSQNGQPGGQQPPRPGFAAGLESIDGHDADVQDTTSRGGVYL